MKAKTLLQTHPSYDGVRLQRLRALVEGGPDWHKLVEHWLPKRAVEPPDIYAERKAMARYVNHAGNVVGTLSALLFSQPPAVSGLEGEYYARLWASCDGKRSSWRSFWRQRLTDAQVGQHAWIQVNLPARAEAPLPDNRRDEERQGLLDAYLVGWKPEQVLDWGEDAQGNLTWVMTLAVTSERAGPTAPRVTTWRWTAITADTLQTWTWTPPAEPSGKAVQSGEAARSPRPEDEVEEHPPIDHRMGRLPVVRLSLPRELWTMHQMEDPAVGALRARNEHTWALHQAANELLVILSVWQDEKINLGHGHFLKLSRDANGQDEARFVGPSGVAFEYLQQDVRDTREEVYRVARQMALAADSDATRARLSGESKKQDWNALEIVLEAYQELALDAMTATLELIAEVRGDDTAELSVSGLEGWRSEDLLAFLEAAALATDARLLSPSFRKAVALRQVERLLGDEVGEERLQTIRQEIEAAEVNPDLYQPPAA